MKRNTLTELYFLRSVACIAVVIIHSIAYTTTYYPEDRSDLSLFIFENFKMLLLFCTPLFVFLSELLISHSYKENLPKNFFKKRIKFILIPYLFMGVFNAILVGLKGNFTLLEILFRIFTNIFAGTFLGYFVLIIFQFYILHVIMQKYLNHLSAKIVLPISLAINILYLGFFNFVSPFDFPFADYVWSHLSWLPFVGWIFYFTLGYYCGKNYERLVVFIKNNKYLFLILPILTASLMLIMRWTILPLSTSKRVDVILYTTSVIFLLILIGITIKSIPKPLIFISRVSFGVYLLHPFFLELGYGIMAFFPNVNDLTYCVSLFVISFPLSVLSTYLLNKTKYGYLLVGKLGASPRYLINKNKNEYIYN